MARCMVCLSRHVSSQVLGQGKNPLTTTGCAGMPHFVILAKQSVGEYRICEESAVQWMRKQSLFSVLSMRLVRTAFAVLATTGSIFPFSDRLHCDELYLDNR